MEDMETRVWQRVRGNPETTVEAELKLQIQTAQELAAVYGRLAKEATGQNREIFRRLQEGEQANIACLRGIALLQGKKITLKTLQVPKEPTVKALEKCYHRSRRAAMAYMSQSAGGECGEVFRALADREGEHCVWITQVLGMMG